MIRIAILLALSPVLGACRPDNQTSNAMASGAENAVAARLEDRAGERSVKGEKESDVFNGRISISSGRGRVTAELAENDAARALLRMLPLTVEMRDHLRQEKTGNLPSALPDLPRQSGFSAGTLGLWGHDDFVIYYRDGSVPQPGIVVLGRVLGDLSIIEGLDPITVRIQRAE